MPPKEPQQNTTPPESPGTPVQDAASLIIVKQNNSGTPSVLMGRRHPGQTFLPNKYVFPGGRYDPADSIVNSAGALPENDLNLLMLDVPDETSRSHAHALAASAIRETFEETGHVIGVSAHTPAENTNPCWQSFLDTGHLPDPSGLRFFARAITPPGRPRRYDTRFFWVQAERISMTYPRVDGELSDIAWITLEDARGLDVASITHHILDDLQGLLQCDQSLTRRATVPFYFHQNDRFHRVLLSHQDGIA